MSLRVKLTAVVGVIVFIGLLVFGGAVQASLQSVLTREIDDGLQSRGSQIAAELADENARGRLTEGLTGGVRLDPTPFEEFAAPGVYVQLATLDGTVLGRSASLGSSGQLPVTAEMVELARRGDSVSLTVSLGGERIRIHSRPVQLSRLTLLVQVGQSLHFVESAMRNATVVLSLAGAITLVLTIGATWVIAGRMLLALSRITAAAEAIAETGDVERPIPADASGDEAGRLGRALQRTTTRLRQLLATQRNLLADTAHELRNPLTVVQTNLDLLRLDLDPATREEVVDETLREVERMSRLVDDLLLLAEVESQEPARYEPVRLDEIARGVAQDLRDRLRGQQLTVIADEPIVVHGDAEQLRRVVVNLVENAIQYAGEGATIRVEVMRDGRRARLVVSDNGPGIDAEHLPHIFDRFYRIDSARRRSTGGTGLGLAIVKEIVAAHGGRVEVQSEPGRETSFTITLPAEPSWVPLANVEAGSLGPDA